MMSEIMRRALSNRIYTSLKPQGSRKSGYKQRTFVRFSHRKKQAPNNGACDQTASQDEGAQTKQWQFPFPLLDRTQTSVFGPFTGFVLRTGTGEKVAP